MLIKPRIDEKRLRWYYWKWAKQVFYTSVLKNTIYYHGQFSLRSTTERLTYIYLTNSLHERGVIGTFCSLQLRCITRDPTSDRKLIEFFANIPVEVFSPQGVAKKIV